MSTGKRPTDVRTALGKAANSTRPSARGVEVKSPGKKPRSEEEKIRTTLILTESEDERLTRLVERVRVEAGRRKVSRAEVLRALIDSADVDSGPLTRWVVEHPEPNSS